MSRIYEALKASNKTKPNPILQLIENDLSRPASVAPVTVEKIEPEAVENAKSASADTGVVGQSSDASSRTSPAEVTARDRLVAECIYRLVSVQIQAGAPILPLDGSDVRAAEQYRILRTNLLHHSRQPKVIAIASASPGDGKTVTAINLGGILAMKSDSNVVIVDADLRRCAVADALGIDSEPGLQDVLRGRCTLDDAIVRIEQLPNLHVLPSKPVRENPTELLDSPKWRAVMAELRERFSNVIIDTTPVAVVADFQLIQHVCDGVLMVVRPDHTNRTTLWKVFEGDNKKLLGTVINAVDDWFLWNSEEDYSYYPEASSKERNRGARSS